LNGKKSIILTNRLIVFPPVSFFSLAKGIEALAVAEKAVRFSWRDDSDFISSG
jgi:hypothetical protein